MSHFAVTITRFDDKFAGGTSHVWVISEQVADGLKEHLGPPDGEVLNPTFGPSDPDQVILINE